LVSSRPQQFLVRVGNSSLAFEVKASERPQRYRLRLSLLHAWWRPGARYELVESDVRVVSEHLLAVP
jgi:hypothetical protein